MILAPFYPSFLSLVKDCQIFHDFHTLKNSEGNKIANLVNNEILHLNSMRFIYWFKNININLENFSP